MSVLRETYPDQFTKHIRIHAPTAAVWAGITNPDSISQWMAETPIEVATNWEVGSEITISGPWYKSRFENRGKVLCYEPNSRLSYSHLSSLSRLPDEEANYTIYNFQLVPIDEATTELTFTAQQFATSAIYHHLAFYWNVTMHKIKQLVETSR